MEVTHYIAARQTGKTRKAASLFHELRSPTTYLMVNDNTNRRQISTKYNIPYNSFLTPHNTFQDKTISTLIIDDYLICVRNKPLFINYLWPAMRGDSKLILISTPDKKYTQEDVTSKPYLFLQSGTDAQYSTTVINTVQYPEQHGFARIDLNGREPMANFFLDRDMFDCEMLGLYLVDQTFGSIYPARPKQFKIKQYT